MVQFYSAHVAQFSAAHVAQFSAALDTTARVRGIITAVGYATATFKVVET